MSNIETARLAPDATGIAEAARLLGAGGLVSFPTETVYGLGGDARNGTAVARIFEAKGRPSFNPLIVHVPDLDTAERYADISGALKTLARRFWPGPLTLVAPLKTGHGLSPLVTAGLETLAIRVPSHPVAQDVLRAFGGPVAAPSANPSGRISPTTAAHVMAGLHGKIEAVLDAGACPVGLESTIVGAAPLALLRPGGLAQEDIEAAVGPLEHAGDAITAPGQMLSHYAPDATVRLNANCANPGEVLLGFGPMQSDLNLSVAGDLVEAAANLFDHLHMLDATGYPIAVAPIPNCGLGQAINDRLRRAAAPRG
ncbi:L-threonylcarbamoyladenylate synthase [Tateyamaria omphalii]|uniref:Threonylcarbamoyl-AMP synthase n=1 Tax=Tateyamaria omphalii TaxID=299262 RepID=A0A1P8MWA1_9RHOB|nr:L-threonylcarbamoyladenylate synthase [Tateyamaria omphalii]APX12298.1 threonylcarbamoyl-AMP synthase [Tateyamaria omphalii]